ncbi:MAG: hypothetical protein V5A22_03770 [Salinivenus sp.]
MTSTDTSPSDSGRSSADAAAHRFSAVRMPIDGPVDDLEEAVERLRQCSSTALRRARTHHRRALESLCTGGYSALSEATRDRLADRLRRNLKALNRALDASSIPDRSASEATPSSESCPSLASRIRAFVQGLW